MTIPPIEKIYDDFLFDCYIANQRLTDEDWRYYGKEEHHIEIPDRDGGILTPLNSQFLTTYQHWIAGVLQSELLGKCCFAMVPKNVLPGNFEKLRKKWNNPLSWDTEEQKLHFEKTSIAVKNWWDDIKINQPALVKRRSEKISQTNIKKWATMDIEIKNQRVSCLRSLSHQGGQAAAQVHHKPLEIVFPDGRIGCYPSKIFATRATGISPASLHRILRGGEISRGPFKGYSARYV